jgi:hypothetical protein
MMKELLVMISLMISLVMINKLGYIKRALCQIVGVTQNNDKEI